MRFYYWVNQSLYKTVGTIKYIVAFIYYGNCQRKGVFLSDGRIAVWRKMIKFAPEIQNNTRYDDN